MVIPFAILFSVLILTSACHKDCCDDPNGDSMQDTTSTDSIHLWSVPLCSADTSDFSSMVPLITDHGVIFSNDFCPFDKALNSHLVFCLDKNDGKLLWSTQTEIKTGNGIRGYNNGCVWIFGGNSIEVIDALTGRTVNSLRLGSETHERATGIGQSVYFTSLNVTRDSVELIKMSIPGLNKKVILKVDKSHELSGKDPYIEPPTLYIDPTTSDSSLIFLNRL